MKDNKYDNGCRQHENFNNALELINNRYDINSSEVIDIMIDEGLWNLFVDTLDVKLIIDLSEY